MTAAAKPKKPKLTPTQCLILDVLAARHRLGETLWTFSTDDKRALDGLEAIGLVHVMRGVAPRSVRARFTDAGVKRMRKEAGGYISPLEKQLKLVQGQLKELRELRRLEHELGWAL